MRVKAVSEMLSSNVPSKVLSSHLYLYTLFIMSPHRIEALPSAAALPSYGISKNGFLPASAPLTRIPNDYYQPWESIIEVLPTLLQTHQLRHQVDKLPVLDAQNLKTEAEWQRAYSMLAVIAQGYIWQGPEPSQVSRRPSCWDPPLLTSILALTPCDLCPLPENCRTPGSTSSSNVCSLEPLELETP